jgi:aldose 1-epimerase
LSDYIEKEKSSMEKVNFGVTKRGEEASLYVLENKNNTTIKVTDYGATLVSLLFADKAGVQKDLVLGYDNVTGYEEHTSYFGAIIGRNGNRIKDSRFTINGKEYRIDENENHNNLHSGKNGFNTVIWEVREHTDNSITFYHYSSETEQKFPGNMEITVTYTIADDDTLHIVYNGKADADTVMNCTNHSYFNLNGHESGRTGIADFRRCLYASRGFKCDSDRRDCIGGGNADGFPNRKTDWTGYQGRF